MSSRLHPRMWKGREDNGGYLSKNRHQKSENSPAYTGKVYVSAPGWYWASGWPRQTRTGSLLALSLRGMSDEEADRYCASSSDTRSNQSPSPTPPEDSIDDIPF